MKGEYWHEWVWLFNTASCRNQRIGEWTARERPGDMREAGRGCRQESGQKS